MGLGTTKWRHLCAQIGHRKSNARASGMQRRDKQAVLRILQIPGCFGRKVLLHIDLGLFGDENASLAARPARADRLAASPVSDGSNGRPVGPKTECAHRVEYALYRYALQRVTLRDAEAPGAMRGTPKTASRHRDEPGGGAVQRFFAGNDREIVRVNLAQINYRYPAVSRIGVLSGASVVGMGSKCLIAGREQYKIHPTKL